MKIPRIHEKFFLIVSTLCILTQWAEAAPQLRIVTNYDEERIMLDNVPKQIILMARSDTQGLRFRWSIEGPGTLKGDFSEPGLFYIPPQSISRQEQWVSIRLAAHDKNGQSATTEHRTEHRFLLVSKPQVIESGELKKLIELVDKLQDSTPVKPQSGLELKLRTLPQQVQPITLGSSIKELTFLARTNREGIRFQWILDGPGALNGNRTSRKIRYILPEKLGAESEDVTVTVIAEDENGAKASEKVTFTLIEPENTRLDLGLLMSPRLPQITLGSTIKELTFLARVTVEGIRFQWKLDGPGYFDGDRTSRKIRYVLPEALHAESQKVAVTVTAEDEYGTTARETVTFTLMEDPQLQEANQLSERENADKEENERKKRDSSDVAPP